MSIEKSERIGAGKAARRCVRQLVHFFQGANSDDQRGPFLSSEIMAAAARTEMADPDAARI